MIEAGKVIARKSALIATWAGFALNRTPKSRPSHRSGAGRIPSLTRRAGRIPDKSARHPSAYFLLERKSKVCTSHVARQNMVVGTKIHRTMTAAPGLPTPSVP
jgi:hypothetical protein